MSAALKIAFVLVALALFSVVTADDCLTRFAPCKINSGKTRSSDGYCTSSRECRPKNKCELKTGKQCAKGTYCTGDKCVKRSPTSTCDSDGYVCVATDRCSGGTCIPRRR